MPSFEPEYVVPASEYNRLKEIEQNYAETYIALLDEPNSIDLLNRVMLAVLAKKKERERADAGGHRQWASLWCQSWSSY